MQKKTGFSICCAFFVWYALCVCVRVLRAAEGDRDTPAIYMSMSMECPTWEFTCHSIVGVLQGFYHAMCVALQATSLLYIEPQITQG